MVNLIDDISAITDVNKNTLKKFIPVINACIGNSVYEKQCKQDPITIVDLGYGELHIKIEDDVIRYRFVPSTELEKTLSQAVKYNISPILLKLEANLQDKIDKTYKELI